MRGLSIAAVSALCAVSLAVGLLIGATTSIASGDERSCSATGHVEWNPDVDQALGQLEEILDTLGQQQPMNYTSANVGFVCDAKLYIVYSRFLDGLSKAECRRTWLEQERWLARRREVVKEAYAEYEGGSLASLTANTAFIEVTKQRIAELEKMMARRARRK
jgi:uncharacterized protein YecT (DUF1311 family)